MTKQLSLFEAPSGSSRSTAPTRDSDSSPGGAALEKATRKAAEIADAGAEATGTLRNESRFLKPRGLTRKPAGGPPQDGGPISKSQGEAAAAATSSSKPRSDLPEGSRRLTGREPGDGPNSSDAASSESFPHREVYPAGSNPGYELPCARCGTVFHFTWHWGRVICATCYDGDPGAGEPDPPTIDAPWDDRCVVIGCVAIAGPSIVGEGVCQAHATEKVAEILEAGHYPGLFEFEGKPMVLKTERKLGESFDRLIASLFKGKPYE